MAERIVITSAGILSAIGHGKEACFHALTHGLSGLRLSQYLISRHAADFPMGEVPFSNDELSVRLGISGGDNGYTRTSLLAMNALQNLLAGIPVAWLNSAPFAFINSTTVAGMCAVENMYADIISDQQEGLFLKYIDTLDCAESTDNAIRHFALKPMAATMSTACSSSANALLLGARLIRNGLVTRALCGGCDALSRYTLNGFHALKNISKTHCRPFDQQRNGLNLGEGAGYVLLEKESDALARGADILAVLSGYSNNNDAYHPTAPAPDGSGALRTMKNALAHAGLQPEDIDFVNAHGTATLPNDVAEGRAIEQLFGGQVPFSSTKPLTGHTLAAAGILEAIFSIWNLQENVTYPNLNFEEQMVELSIEPETKSRHKNIKHVLSNSFGFGGNNVSLVLSKS
jgi:3-oxoacyl-[acyl-carrier-protein] synthase-1